MQNGLGVRDKESSNLCNYEKEINKRGVEGIKEKESTGLGDLLYLGLVA